MKVAQVATVIEALIVKVRGAVVEANTAEVAKEVDVMVTVLKEVPVAGSAETAEEVVTAVEANLALVKNLILKEVAEAEGVTKVDGAHIVVIADEARNTSLLQGEVGIVDAVDTAGIAQVNLSTPKEVHVVVKMAEAKGARIVDDA